MKNNSQVKIYNPAWVEEETGTLDLGRLEFLKGNPFLYNPLNSPYIVSSIEDYQIKYKKDYKTFGSLVRNATFSRGRRKRIARKAFDFWDNDIKKAQEARVTTGASVIETSGNIKVKKFSVKIKLLLWLMLTILILINYLGNGFFVRTFGGDFFALMKSLINTGFSTNSWLKIIMNITLYVIIITLIYAKYFNINIQDFKRITDSAHSMLDKNTRILDREYEKKIKKTEKYYVTNIYKKNYTFPPYLMNMVCEGKIGNQTLDKISQEVIDKSSNFKKKKFWFQLFKNLLVLLSIIGTLLVIVYVVYEVVKNFIL